VHFDRYEEFPVSADVGEKCRFLCYLLSARADARPLDLFSLCCSSKIFMAGRREIAARSGDGILRVANLKFNFIHERSRSAARFSHIPLVSQRRMDEIFRERYQKMTNI
jgi:hypothetical protein